MIPYALYHCCRRGRNLNYQRDRGRARMLLLVAMCAFYASIVSHYF